MHYIDPCVLVTDSDIWMNCRKCGVERTNSTVEVDHVLYVAHLYALLDQHISKHLHERTDHCSLPFLTSQLSSRMYFSLFRMRSAFTLLERLWWTGVLVDEVLNLLRLWPKPDTNPAANKSKHLHCTSLQITASHRSNDRQILDFDGLKLGLVCHSLFLFSFFWPTRLVSWPAKPGPCPVTWPPYSQKLFAGLLYDYVKLTLPTVG